MSAEPRQITTPDVWRQWEGKVVNSVFPLRRFLGGSGRNGVFLTAQTAEHRPDVAIKFVPADTVQAEAQLLQWGASTALQHPNLVRIFDVGRYRFEGREYVFVVTEYADQTLAEILPRRPLAVEEVRELLVPTLDALLFLHRKGLIHGHLKPSNFLAVDDRLKLASDTVRPINHAGIGRARTSAYDPPELKDRGMNAAGDIWGLGMTLLEALTQHTTAWPDETVSIPADLPAPFANAVLKCLSIAPAARPTVIDLDAQFKAAAPVQPTPAAQPSARQASESKSASAPPARKPGSWRRALAILLPCAIAAWLIVHFFGNQPTPSQPPAAVAPTPAPPVAPATEAKPVEPQVPAATSPAPPTPALPEDVVQLVTPDVPPNSLTKIRGRIPVTVRVLVDPNGDVMGAMLESPGPSKYLAGLAEQAAGDWKFAPTVRQQTRVWLLQFVFTRDGVTAQAIAQ